MAKKLNFLTGSPSTRLTDKQNANYVSINPGSVYFTSDGKIYFDLNDTTRLWMGQNAGYAASAGAFSAEKTIQLTGGATGSALGGKDGGWTIDVTVDGSKHTHEQYVLRSGDTLSGKLSLVANANTDSLTSGALDAKGSNIQGVNAIYFNTASTQKGISFIRNTTNSTVDTIYAASGVLYFVPNRTIGSAGTGHIVLHSNNYNTYTVTKEGAGATGTWGIAITGKAASADALTTTSVGDTDVPVYFDSTGKPKVCTSLSLDTTGNAATATTLQGQRKINGTIFDGSDDIVTTSWGPKTSFVISDGTNSGAAIESVGGGTVTISLPSTIKATLTGTADKAKALTTTTAGSEKVPVYFVNGKPVACTSLSLDTTGNAATATTANQLKGFSLTIGGKGETITGKDNVSYSLVDIGAISRLGDTINGDLTIPTAVGSFIGNLIGNANTATTATKLSTSAGSATKPVYFADGAPSECTSPLDVSITGAADRLSADAGTGKNLLTFTGGKPTASNSNEGASKQFVYLKAGSLTATTDNVGGAAQPLYMKAGVMTPLSETVGSASKPVYLKDGTITECGDTLSTNISGVAAKAASLAAPVSLTIGTTSQSFNGTGPLTWSAADITGVANASGVAPLVNGLIPAANLPSYVDDVVEGYYRNNKFYTSKTDNTTEMAAVSGIIYVDQDTHFVYRWSGSAYIQVTSGPLVIGTVTGTAFDGGTGHGHVTNTNNPHSTTYIHVQALGTQTTTAQTVASAVTFSGAITASKGVTGNLTGNVTGTANKAKALTSNITINGTAFNAGSDTRTKYWGNACSFTIGSQSLDVDGNGTYSWSHSQIGATVGTAIASSASTNTITITVNGVSKDVIIPAGTKTKAGLLTAEAQEIAGTKTFSDKISGTITNADFAAEAAKLTPGASINGTVFDGTKSITTNSWGTARAIKISGTASSSAGNGVSVDGSSTTGYTLLLPKTLSGFTKITSTEFVGPLTGLASQATKLANKRAINGTDFDGTGAITTATWGTARAITIGEKQLNVNGSENYSWSLSEIDTNLSTVKTYTKTIVLKKSWTDVIASNSATSYLEASGTYIVQVYINDQTNSLKHYDEYYSGIMSWHKGAVTTGTDADEIILHKAGKNSSGHNIYLRTVRKSNGYLTLQIAADEDDTDTTGISIQFKFRRLI